MRDEILDSLASMMRAATPAARQLHATRREPVKCYGHLHVVLRDSSQPEEECHQIIFGLEKPNAHNVELTSRNEVRELVLRAFETTPKVWCLPKVDANASVGLPSDYTQNPRTYVGVVDALRDAIIAQARVPKMLDGIPLTGARIVDEIRLAVNADDVAKQELRALKDAVEQDTKEDAVTFSFVTCGLRAGLSRQDAAALPGVVLERQSRETKGLQAACIHGAARQDSTRHLSSLGVASGEQLRAVQEYLRDHPDVELVWYDYWCLPQGNDKTLAEEVFVCEDAAAHQPPLLGYVCPRATRQLLLWSLLDVLRGIPLNAGGERPWVASGDGAARHRQDSARCQRSAEAGAHR